MFSASKGYDPKQRSLLRAILIGNSKPRNIPNLECFLEFISPNGTSIQILM